MHIASCRLPSVAHFVVFVAALVAILLPALTLGELFGDEQSGTTPDSSHTILKLSKRDDTLARDIAKANGMVVRGRPFLDSHYFVEHESKGISRRKKRSVLMQLEEHPDVEWIREDAPRRRTKRDYVGEDPNQSQASSLSTMHIDDDDVNITRSNRQARGASPTIPRLPFADPLYNDQWYLVGRAVGGFDMNVREAWLLGYAGRNVSISILDDGIQRDHADLASNYDPMASTDINDHDDDPTPQNNGDNKHGTRCAGEVAAIAGNNVCGVGVAFLSRIGGVRMLDGPVSDSVEAASLTLRQDHIDIYSASWGPEDDGKTFDGPGALAQEAFYRGIKQGRGGRGNIFVWASGNGGSRQDSCSADGYTTSIYTLSISSATFDNRRPWYLEECPSTIATTYSSANINQPAIVTVDVPSDCTKMHTGTSASAPLAAGIIALAMEANPWLTWRDTQHIVLRTANPVPLLANAGWSTNGVGRRISNKFGYGLMDAGALVRLARQWKRVPEQHMCTYEYQLERPNPRPLIGRFKMNFSLDVTGCTEGTPVLYLEHVQVVATVRYAKRGDLKLTLTSPSGTESILLPPRPQDFNQNGFHKWPFLSVQAWGEDPRGTWTLQVESVTNNPRLTGMFSDWSLLLYGTAEPAQVGDPHHDVSRLPHTFHANTQGQLHQSLTSQTPELTSTTMTTIESPSESEMLRADATPSVGNCHSECIGCAESGSAVGCHACKHYTQALRNRAGFKCVARCEEGFFAVDDKCKKCSSNCQTCTEAERCEQCHGSLLLIVTHTQRLDQGHCVAECPLGLRADYSHALQARCLIKSDFCEHGYFEGIGGRCEPCNEACGRCHGAGPLECLTCAQNYGNSTIGYCRPCCTGEQTPESTHHECERCGQLDGVLDSKSSIGFSKLTLFIVIMLVLSIVGCTYCQFKRSNASAGSGLEYVPLTNSDYTKLGTTMVDNSDDSDDDGLSLTSGIPTSIL